MDLAVVVYTVAKQLPPSERFELSAQMRRAAISVPANIAEGHATGRDGLFSRQLRIALGSVGEPETLFEIARRLEFASETDLASGKEQLVRVGQLLHGLLRSVQKRRVRPKSRV